jgi:site-specific DNA-adenine methylase
MDQLKAPFPWFGGKSRVADVVWQRFGDVQNYVEPFAGSLAVLLGRPHEPRVETVNDKDCYLANFWRALASAPDELAAWCDWPVNEADLQARHTWLVNQTTEWRQRMKMDPYYYDVQVASWWVWGISQWIGSGWCSRPDWTGRGSAVRSRGLSIGGHAKAHVGIKNDGTSQERRPALTYTNGIHRVSQQLPLLSSNNGVNSSNLTECRYGLQDYFYALAARLRRVRVCCGDWSRVMGPSPTFKIGLTGVFLDPPYSDPARDKNLYNEDCMEIAKDVRAWCLENGENPLLRIALCGYEGEHDMPIGWECFAWKASGGYSNKFDTPSAAKENAARERIWFSPACLKDDQLEMFK